MYCPWETFFPRNLAQIFREKFFRMKILWGSLRTKTCSEPRISSVELSHVLLLPLPGLFSRMSPLIFSSQPSLLSIFTPYHLFWTPNPEQTKLISFILPTPQMLSFHREKKPQRKRPGSDPTLLISKIAWSYWHLGLGLPNSNLWESKCQKTSTPSLDGPFSFLSCVHHTVEGEKLEDIWVLTQMLKLE